MFAKMDVDNLWHIVCSNINITIPEVKVDNYKLTHTFPCLLIIKGRCEYTSSVSDLEVFRYVLSSCVGKCHLDDCRESALGICYTSDGKKTISYNWVHSIYVYTQTLTDTKDMYKYEFRALLRPS